MNVELAKQTIQKCLLAVRSNPPSGQSLLTFLKLRDATPFDEKPKFLICDHDKKYGAMFQRVAQASGSDVIHTPYKAPRANAMICERFAGCPNGHPQTPSHRKTSNTTHKVL